MDTHKDCAFARAGNFLLFGFCCHPACQSAETVHGLNPTPGAFRVCGESCVRTYEALKLLMTAVPFRG